VSDAINARRVRVAFGGVSVTYHHGDLRNALLDVAVALARSDGPSAVVLREVSRRAVVSHNAAYRHFAGRDRLLQATSGRCHREQARLMECRLALVARSGDPVLDAWTALRCMCRSYVEFALVEPGWFKTAFVAGGFNEDDADCRSVVDREPGAVELLGARLDSLVEVGVLPPSRRTGAEYRVWAAVHGLAVLLSGGPLRGLTPPERDVAIERTLATMMGGISAPGVVGSVSAGPRWTGAGARWPPAPAGATESWALSSASPTPPGR